MGMLDFARSANYGRFYGDLKKLAPQVHKPAWLMFADAGISSVLYGSGLQDYLNYRFYEKGPKERSTYATIGYQDKVYRKYSSPAHSAFFSNKVNFHKNFAKYARRDFYDPETGYEGFAAFVEKHPVFVRKPYLGLGGSDVEKIDSADIADLRAFWEAMEANNEFAEELVVQDERWAALSPGSTNTLRVVTFADAGKSRLAMAVARIGSGASVVDNFHAGGKAVLVDDVAGKLVGNGIAKNLDESSTSPTGIVFDGYEIPYWDQVVEMVLEAALVNEDVKIIGWDVALAQDGPLIIEANRGPGFDVMQVAAKRGLKPMMQEFVDEMEARARSAQG